MTKAFVTRCSSVVLAFGVLLMAPMSDAQVPTPATPATPYDSPQKDYNPPFPRLGMIYIGGDPYMSPPDWPILGKFNVVILGQNSEGWGGGTWSTAASQGQPWLSQYGSTRTRSLIVDGIHAASIANNTPGGQNKVFQYVEMEAKYATWGLAGSTGPSGGWLDGTDNNGITGATTATLNSNNTYPHFTSLISKDNWWLYNNGTTQKNGLAGPEVVSSGSGLNNSSTWVWNMTHYVSPDPTFGYPYQAAANYAYHEWINSDMTAFPDALGNYQNATQASRNSSPNFDGIFLDNCWYGPMQSGDWNLDGTTENAQKNGFVPDPAVLLSYEQSNADFAQSLHSLSTAAGNTKMAICNNGNWVSASYLASKPGEAIGSSGDNAQPPTGIGPLYQQFEGGVDEAVIGPTNAREYYQGFNSAMHAYMDLMDMMAAPKAEIFNQEGLNNDGSDCGTGNPTCPSIPRSQPGSAIRYGITMAMMNDGYYDGEVANDHVGPGYLPGTPGYPSGTTLWNSPKVWWEEYDGGGIGQGYLGMPVSGPTGAVQRAPRWPYGITQTVNDGNNPYFTAGPGGYGIPGGVWAREFQNGLVIVNPKGNGPVTLTTADLGGVIWKHFQGNDPAITNDPNDGSVVATSITIPDRDGIILLRIPPVAANVTVKPDSSTILLGQTVTLTANVSTGGQDGTIPTGSVTFTDSTTGTALGTGTLDSNGNATVSVSSLAAGSHTITATYDPGSDLNHLAGSGQTSVTVTDFAIAATPGSLNVKQGEYGSAIVSVSAVAGFSSAVALTAGDLPAGVTVAIAPASLSGTGTSQVIVTVATTATAGTYPIIITGTSGTLSHATTVSLTVCKERTTPNRKDFSLAASPASLTIAQGKSGSTTVVETPIHGYTASVFLSVRNLPAGVTACYGKLNGRALTTELTFKVASRATPGTYPVTITGIQGQLAHSTAVLLTVVGR